MVEKKKLRQTSPRIARKRRQVRGEIIGAARDLLHDQGVDGVTLASVAGELGMTKQGLYHYYASKEALLRALISTLIDEEIEALVAAVQAEKNRAKVLGTLIRAFYDHYVERFDAFRIVYCQSQLSTGTGVALDPETIRKEINPRTRKLFDVMEERLAKRGASEKKRRQLRELAFAAWVSALGLMTMLSVADASRDPLIHPDRVLLDSLTGVFENQFR